MVSDLSGRGAQWRGLGEDHLRSCRSRQKPTPVCPGRAPRVVQVLQTVSVHYPRHGGRTHSDIGRAKETPCGNGRAADFGDFTIGVSEDDLRVIAEHGYEGAASTDHDQQAQAVSLFAARLGWKRKNSASLLASVPVHSK